MIFINQYLGISNLYTNLDAANPVNEVSAAPNWTYESGGAITVSSVGTDSTSGIHCLEFNYTGASGSYGGVIVPVTGLEIGASYIVTVDAKKVIGGNWEMWLTTSQGWGSDTGIQLNQVAGVGPWGENSRTSTATATTANIRISVTTASITGWKLRLDNFRVQKV